MFKISKAYPSLNFFSRSYPWLIPGAITIPGLIGAMYIHADGGELAILWKVIITFSILYYLFIISTFRYYVLGIQLDKNNDSFKLVYVDWFIEKDLICNPNDVVVKAKLSVNDFKKTFDKGGSILIVKIKKKTIKTRLKEYVFLNQYFDLIEMFDLDINIKMQKDLKYITKYVDDDMAIRIQELLANAQVKSKLFD